MTNKELKQQIKIDLGLDLMVRNYNNRLKTISVWLFPKDRNKENCEIVKEYLIKKGYYRVDGFNLPNQNIFCVNGGEFNSLRIIKK